MARIRSIRPEFFSDEKMGRLTPYARLFYQALWCFADDEGRGRCLERELEGFAFPNEPSVSAHVLLTELANMGRIVMYDANGERYYWIPTFKEYQKPNRPLESKLPAPPLDIQPITEPSLSAHAQPTAGSLSVVGEGVGDVDVVGEVGGDLDWTGLVKGIGE